MNGEYEHVRYALLLATRQGIVELGEKNIFSILFFGYFSKLFLSLKSILSKLNLKQSK